MTDICTECQGYGYVEYDMDEPEPCPLCNPDNE